MTIIPAPVAGRGTATRVLVTGAAGFLGSHLCDRLLRSDPAVEVIGVDNLFSGARANLVHLKDHPRFHFMVHDVTEPLQLHVDRIFNLACPASPIHYQFDPVHTLKTSVLGALNLLELAKRCKARILQASTSEVYGDPETSPQRETYRGSVNCFGPRACYDEGKRAAETLFFDFSRMWGTDIRIVRIFNTYGPRMRADDGRVVSNFIVQALQDAPITVYGEGTQTRSFCFVDDLIDGMVRAMDSDAAAEGPVNLGNPVEITVTELADRVIRLTGSRSRIEYHPLPVDDPMQRRPDIARAAAWLGWAPAVPLAEGLERTVQYFAGTLGVRPIYSEAAE